VTRVIGIDIGGVLIQRVEDDEDTSFFSDNYLDTPPVDHAFTSLRTLRDKYFGDDMHLVSTCGATTEAHSREWLAKHDFYAVTGLTEDRVHFCRRRADKAPIAQRLGLTDFVDDRLEVLGYLRDVVDRRWLFQPRAAEVTKHDALLPDVIAVAGWQELVGQLLEVEVR
jgi:hypothetical protein